MKCKICGKDYDQTRITACPICGFHPFFVVGDMDEGQRHTLEMAENNYKRNFFAAFTVSIIAYEWTPDEEELLVLHKKHKLPFDACSNMNPGEVNWMKESFARLEGTRVELDLSVERTGEKEQLIKASVDMPQAADFWRVGISFEDGMKLKVHLKAGDQETVSEGYDILTCTN